MYPSLSVQPKQIQTITISMTPKGWWEQRKRFPLLPGVYIVFCKFEQKKYTLRVGIASGKSGIYGRWFNTLGSHYHIWKEKKQRTEGYHEFYTQTAALCTEIEVKCLLYPHCTSQQIRGVEKQLIHQLKPIWEDYWIDGLPAFKEQFFVMRYKINNTKPCLYTMLKKNLPIGR